LVFAGIPITEESVIIQEGVVQKIIDFIKMIWQKFLSIVNPRLRQQFLDRLVRRGKKRISEEETRKAIIEVAKNISFPVVFDYNITSAGFTVTRSEILTKLPRSTLSKIVANPHVLSNIKNLKHTKMIRINPTTYGDHFNINDAMDLIITFKHELGHAATLSKFSKQEDLEYNLKACVMSVLCEHNMGINNSKAGYEFVLGYYETPLEKAANDYAGIDVFTIWGIEHLRGKIGLTDDIRKFIQTPIPVDTIKAVSKGGDNFVNWIFGLQKTYPSFVINKTNIPKHDNRLGDTFGIDKKLDDAQPVKISKFKVSGPRTELGKIGDVTIQQESAFQDIESESDNFNVHESELKSAQSDLIEDPVILEASGNSADKRKQIEELVIKTFDALDPSKINSNKYHEMFASMNDQQFKTWADGFFKDNKSGFRWDIEEFDAKRKPDFDNIEKAANGLGIKLFEYVYMPHVSSDPKRPIRTKIPVLVGYMPIKRTQQMGYKKTNLALSDTDRDDMTGQLKGDSKSGTATGMENQLLQGVGANYVLKELIGSRADNQEEYMNMLKHINETGSIKSLDDIKTSVYDKGTVLKADMFLTAMGIKTDLVTESYMAIDKVKHAAGTI
jgi:hypothetical protein